MKLLALIVARPNRQVERPFFCFICGTYFNSELSCVHVFVRLPVISCRVFITSLADDLIFLRVTVDVHDIQLFSRHAGKSGIHLLQLGCVQDTNSGHKFRQFDSSCDASRTRESCILSRWARVQSYLTSSARRFSPALAGATTLPNPMRGQ